MTSKLMEEIKHLIKNFSSHNRENMSLLTLRVLLDLAKEINYLEEEIKYLREKQK